jgi:hypothetical protein
MGADERHEAMRNLSRARQATKKDLQDKRQQISALLLRPQPYLSRFFPWKLSDAGLKLCRTRPHAAAFEKRFTEGDIILVAGKTPRNAQNAQLEGYGSVKLAPRSRGSSVPT